MLEQVMQEVCDVAKAKGVTMPDNIVERSLEIIKTFSDDMYASTYHDLMAGRPLEIASFSGLLSKLGRELGVSRERARQLEARAKRKLAEELKDLAPAA